MASAGEDRAEHVIKRTEGVVNSTVAYKKPCTKFAEPPFYCENSTRQLGDLRGREWPQSSYDDVTAVGLSTGAFWQEVSIDSST